MQTLMLRLDALVRRRRGVVLAPWAVFLVAALPPRAQLAAVLIPERGAGPEQVRAAIGRVADAAGRTANVELSTAARRRAEADAAAGRGSPILVALDARVSEDDAIDVARDLRDELQIADGPRDGVATHLVGQGALWAGLTDLSREDLASAETIGFPIV